jgi:hypothetical protein
MQIDMHMYGVFVLARAAGINYKTAWLIANTSQFVDDSIEDDEFIVSDSYGLLPTMTSHKPIDYQNALHGDQWKVWIPFHFLPGNEPENGTFLERLRCRKNSKPARRMVEESLDDKNRHMWPYLIGLTAHVYADTFAHYGFIGISTKLNIVKNSSIKVHNVNDSGLMGALEQKFTQIAGMFTEIIPVGHGTVSTYPDMPFLEWQYHYEHPVTGTDGIVKRNNADDFLEGAQHLHQYFCDYAEKDPSVQDSSTKRKWEDIKDNVSEIIQFQSMSKDKRIEKWRDAIREGTIYSASREPNIDYNNYEWTLEQVKNTGVSPAQAQKTHACNFLRAAHHHRHFVLHQLLPEFGILVN